MSKPAVSPSDRNVTQDHFFGNADMIGAEPGRNGWFMGPYHLDCHPILADDLVEVKWGIHHSGESRDCWSQEEEKWSLSVLIEGDFSIEFDGTKYRLIRPGDFVVWQPKVRHKWHANNKSMMLTVRWRAPRREWFATKRNKESNA